MSEECRQKALAFVIAKILAFWVLVLPLAVMAGTFLGLVEDFGVSHTVATIRLNPGIFAEQYAPGIVFAGWASIVSLIVMAVIVCVVAIRRYGKRPTPDERQSPAAPLQLH